MLLVAIFLCRYFHARDAACCFTKHGRTRSHLGRLPLFEEFLGVHGVVVFDAVLQLPLLEAHGGIHLVTEDAVFLQRSV
jgi:hypothetical protein